MVNNDIQSRYSAPNWTAVVLFCNVVCDCSVLTLFFFSFCQILCRWVHRKPWRPLGPICRSNMKTGNPGWADSHEPASLLFLGVLIIKHGHTSTDSFTQWRNVPLKNASNIIYIPGLHRDHIILLIWFVLGIFNNGLEIVLKMLANYPEYPIFHTMNLTNGIPCSQYLAHWLLLILAEFSLGDTSNAPVSVFKCYKHNPVQIIPT